MRALVVTVALLAAWPAAVRGQGVPRMPASAHQERAFAALEAGDHATASSEFFEAFLITRNLNLLAGAAQEAEQAGLGREAATYYYLYANLARLTPEETNRLRIKVTQQHWGAGTSVRPTPPPPVRPPVAAPVPATPPGNVPATVASSTGSVGQPPPPDADIQPEPYPAIRPIPQPAAFRPQLPQQADTDVRIDRVWYGRQLLAVDGIVAGSIIIGVEADFGGLTAIGVIGAILGPPIVHAAHKWGGSGWAAFGLRLLGAGILASATESYAGALLGYGLGAGVDIMFQAYDRVPRVEPVSSLAIIPTGRGLTLAWAF